MEHIETCEDCTRPVETNSIGEYPPPNSRRMVLCWDCWDEYRIADCMDAEEKRCS